MPSTPAICTRRASLCELQAVELQVIASREPSPGTKAIISVTWIAWGSKWFVVRVRAPTTQFVTPITNRS